MRSWIPELDQQSWRYRFPIVDNAFPFVWWLEGIGVYWLSPVEAEAVSDLLRLRQDDVLFT